MPEPLSPNSGFGMKVTVLPAALATFLTTYLYSIRLSAMAQQRVELDVDLGLAGGADLVVLHLDRDAALDQLADHLRAQVGVVVHRRHREVAALVAGLVAEVAARLVAAGVPGALDRVDVVEALVRAGLVPGGVEDVELGLRAEVRGVGDAAAAQVVLGLAGDVARVAGVGLAGQRVVDEEGQVQRLVRRGTGRGPPWSGPAAAACRTRGSAGSRGSTSRRTSGPR